MKFTEVRAIDVNSQSEISGQKGAREGQRNKIETKE
jgi:hypothetical protein